MRHEVTRNNEVNDDVTARVQRIDSSALESDLEAQGWSVLRDLLTAQACDDIAGLYDKGAGFRSHVVMARYGFGRFGRAIAQGRRRRLRRQQPPGARRAR